MHLYELGLVSVEYDENLEARFKLTETAIKALEEGEKNV